MNSVIHLDIHASVASFQKRDKCIADQSSRVIALCDGVSGDTKNTIEYAGKCEVEVEYVQFALIILGSTSASRIRGLVNFL